MALLAGLKIEWVTGSFAAATHSDLVLQIVGVNGTETVGEGLGVLAAAALWNANANNIRASAALISLF